MNDIINKVYVINLEKRPDKWDTVQLNFSETDLKLNRWNGVDGKNISEETIQKITTPKCNMICSYGMIGCWLSHFGIWNNIVKNNETNVLVLEDDAYPIDNFNNLIKKLWPQVPNDWDIIYLGCSGSCEKNRLITNFYTITTGQKNKYIYKNGKKLNNVYIPGTPLTTHAYMISNKGARKLLQHPSFKKIDYHVDCQLTTIFEDGFKVYAFDPNLIYQKNDSDYSDNQNCTHPLLSTMGSKVKIGSYMNLDGILFVVIGANRPLGVNITTFTITLFVISFMIGYFGSNNVKNWYLYILTLLYFLEFIWYNKFTSKKLKELIVEVLIILSGIFLGEKIKTMTVKT
jgi:GR25 family glycosyltransferase involved in LPS biosynthesis